MFLSDWWGLSTRFSGFCSILLIGAIAIYGCLHIEIDAAAINANSLYCSDGSCPFQRIVFTLILIERYVLHSLIRHEILNRFQGLEMTATR